MAIKGNALTEYRDVIVQFNLSEGVDIVGQVVQRAMSLDAHKAAINKVAEIEAEYAADNTAVADLSDVTLVFTGTSRYKLYSFQLTLDISEGLYKFVWNETVPNSAGLS